MKSREIVLEIMREALKVSTSGHDLFVNYYGHVNEMSWRFFRNGWKPETEPTHEDSFYCVGDYNDRAQISLDYLKQTLQAASKLEAK